MTPSPDVSLCDLDPDALAILRDLFFRADLHWEHRPISDDPEARAPAWVQEAVSHIHHVHTSTFGTVSKIPATWMQAHASALPLTDGKPMTWDQTRSLILGAVDAMLSDPGYRKGSKFCPEEIVPWFLTKSSWKPAWSCFLKYANVPLIQRLKALDPLSLAAEGYQDRGTATIQRIRNAMTPDAVDAVEQALRYRGVTVYNVTAWERVARLYGWWQGAGKLRDQFGDQLDRLETMRHGYRWDKAMGRFGGLVQLAVEWSQEKGGWKGWFPIPADAGEWADFGDWMAREYAVWIVEMPERLEAASERRVRCGWEKAFDLADLAP